MRALLCIGLGLVAIGCRDKAPAPASKPPRPEVQGPTLVRCDALRCPPEPEPATVRSDAPLRVYVDAEPASLCALVEHDVWTQWIVENQINETLLEQRSSDGSFAPRLAESFTIGSGGLRLAMQLRKGVRWHDGKAFTSDDVRFTLELARDPAVGADQRDELLAISKIETPTAHEVTLTLSRPAPFLRQSLAHLGILPRHAFVGTQPSALKTAQAARSPIGTGPFRFVRWTAGDRIVVARNEEYWGTRTRVAEVIYRIVRDKQVALELYRRGELDLLWRLPETSVSSVTGDRALSAHRMYRWTPRAYSFIVWNASRGPFADARVRKAMALIVPRERYLAFDPGARAITGPYLPGSASYDERVTPWPRDVEAGRALLKEAGFAAGFRFTFLTTAQSQTSERMATWLKEDLKPFGVEVDIASVDWGVLLDRLRRHDFDASTLQWMIDVEQDNQPIFHSASQKSGQNYGAFADPEVDALITRISGTADDGARHTLERTLHRTLYERQPYLFLSMAPVSSLVSPHVVGLVPSPRGFDFAAAGVTP